MRNAEVSYLREFCDAWFSITMKEADLNSPITATTLPADPAQIAAAQRVELQEVADALKSVEPAIKRAPEPLTDHLRLFLERMERAGHRVPYDIELAKVAVVEFRSAMNQYVRRGRTSGVRLFPNESADEYDRVAGRMRMPRNE